MIAPVSADYPAVGAVVKEETAEVKKLSQQSKIATARVQPAEAALILIGKHDTDEAIGRERFEIRQLLDVTEANLAAGSMILTARV